MLEMMSQDQEPVRAVRGPEQQAELPGGGQHHYHHHDPTIRNTNTNIMNKYKAPWRRSTPPSPSLLRHQHHEYKYEYHEQI